MSNESRGRTFGLEDEKEMPIGGSDRREFSRKGKIEPFGKYLKRKGGEFATGIFSSNESHREHRDRIIKKQQEKKESPGKKDELWKRGLAKQKEIIKRFEDQKLWASTRMTKEKRRKYGEELFPKTGSGYVKERVLKEERKNLRKEIHSAKTLKEIREAKGYQNLLDKTFGKPKK